MSANEQLLALSAVELRRRIGTREISPVELLETCIERIARINPEKVALLRGAARVVERPADAGPAALDEVAHRDRRSAERRAVVREMFHSPGTATARALEMVYDLLEVAPRACHAPSHAVETAGSVS